VSGAPTILEGQLLALGVAHEDLLPLADDGNEKLEAQLDRWEARVKLLEERIANASLVLEGVQVVAGDGPAPSPTCVALSHRTAAVEAEHGPGFASPHELLGVLTEEVTEFVAEVYKKDHLRSPLRMADELRDIAVVCIRGIDWLEAGR